jgi:hypothetical protein
MGKWRYCSNFLDLDKRWRLVVSFTLQPIYCWGKCSLYPSDMMLGGLQNRSGRCREENEQLHCWEKKPGQSSPSVYRLLEKICSNATFFTSNSARPDFGLNPRGLSWKPATNRLSCGAGSGFYGAALRSTVFQFVTLCCSKTARRFEGICRHHLQDETVHL